MHILELKYKLHAFMQLTVHKVDKFKKYNLSQIKSNIYKLIIKVTNLTYYITSYKKTSKLLSNKTAL